MERVQETEIKRIFEQVGIGIDLRDGERKREEKRFGTFVWFDGSRI